MSIRYRKHKSYVAALVLSEAPTNDVQQIDNIDQASLFCLLVLSWYYFVLWKVQNHFQYKAVLSSSRSLRFWNGFTVKKILLHVYSVFHIHLKFKWKYGFIINELKVGQIGWYLTKISGKFFFVISNFLFNFMIVMKIKECRIL